MLRTTPDAEYIVAISAWFLGACHMNPYTVSEVNDPAQSASGTANQTKLLAAGNRNDMVNKIIVIATVNAPPTL